MNVGFSRRPAKSLRSKQPPRVQFSLLPPFFKMNRNELIEAQKKELMEVLGFQNIALFLYGEETTPDSELFALEKVFEFYQKMPHIKIKN